MPDEHAARTPGFVEGTKVRLADGQDWSFPERRPDRDDPEYDAVLVAVAEAEDQTERLRAELALTILLLSRNYQLGPDDYRALLGYPPNDPALAELQAVVHRLARAHLRHRSESQRQVTNSLPVPHPRLWSLWSH